MSLLVDILFAVKTIPNKEIVWPQQYRDIHTLIPSILGVFSSRDVP